MKVMAELDSVLESYKGSAFAGKEAAYVGYRNHCQRVSNAALINLQAMGFLTPRAEKLVPVAAAFHDIGIWTSHTWDYLDPSAKAAQDYMAQRSTEFSEADQKVVVAMIEEHHKFFPVDPKGDADQAMVEAFRRGDWMEVSFGVFKWEVTGAQIKELQELFPVAGFFNMLAGIAWDSFIKHPFRNPMPMMRW